MRHLLVVAFHFPPDTSSGNLRTLKYVTYLLDHGWRSTVISVPTTLYDSTDTKALDDLPADIRVVRTPAFDSKAIFSIHGKYPSLVAIPDRYWSWRLQGLRQAIEITREQGVDALYSTSPVPTAHILARALKRRTGLPWIADFRDPWAEPHQFQGSGRLRLHVERFLERSVVNEADRLIMTTRTMKERLEARHPEVARQRLDVITNGFDEADFVGLPEDHPQPPPPLTILHPGAINPGFRDPTPLLAAMSRLVQKGKVLREDLVLRFLGGGPLVESPEFRQQLENLGLEDCIEILPRIGHLEALAEMKRAHLLLLIQYTEALGGQIPAKIFEFARVGTPVLALVSAGETRDLVRQYELGLTVDPSDQRGIEKALLALLAPSGWQPATPPTQRVLRDFDRRYLTKRLATHLDSLIAVEGD